MFKNLLSMLFSLMLMVILASIISCPVTAPPPDSDSSDEAVSINADSYESDDESGSATEITVNGVAQNHTIHVSTDVDWVYFSATSGMYYVISCNGSEDILDMYLYSEDDLTNDIDWGYIGDPMNFSCTQDGNYYVKIESYENQTGNYSIDIQESTPPNPDAYEPDNNSTDATEIIVNGVAQDHTIHVSSDVDWVYFLGASGTDYIISCNGSQAILDMYLYSEDDLINDIDCGFIGDPINFSCTQDGNYYVEIESYDNQIGNYSIDIQIGFFTSGKANNKLQDNKNSIGRKRKRE